MGVQFRLRSRKCDEISLIDLIIMELHGTLSPPHEIRSSFTSITEKLEHVLSGVKLLVAEDKLPKRSVRALSEMESDLRLLLAGDLIEGDLSECDLGDWVRRAYLMIQEADRTYREQSRLIEELQIKAIQEADKARLMRIENEELENRILKLQKAHLIERCSFELGKDKAKSSIADLLREEYEKEHRRRKAAESECVNLKSLLSAYGGNTPEREIGKNLFEEIISLREVIKVGLYEHRGLINVSSPFTRYHCTQAPEISENESLTSSAMCSVGQVAPQPALSGAASSSVSSRMVEPFPGSEDPDPTR